MTLSSLRVKSPPRRLLIRRAREQEREAKEDAGVRRVVELGAAAADEGVVVAVAEEPPLPWILTLATK